MPSLRAEIGARCEEWQNAEWTLPFNDTVGAAFGQKYSFPTKNEGDSCDKDARR